MCERGRGMRIQVQTHAASLHAVTVFVSCQQGRSDGGYIGIYPPPRISLPYKFLCGYWLFFFSLTQDKLLLILKLE